jgi:hypothetical protein
VAASYLTPAAESETQEGGPKAALCSKEAKNRTYFFRLHFCESVAVSVLPSV